MTDTDQGWPTFQSTSRINCTERGEQSLHVEYALQYSSMVSEVLNRNALNLLAQEENRLETMLRNEPERFMALHKEATTPTGACIQVTKI